MEVVWSGRNALRLGTRFKLCKEPVVLLVSFFLFVCLFFIIIIIIIRFLISQRKRETCKLPVLNVSSCRS